MLHIKNISIRNFFSFGAIDSKINFDDLGKVVLVKGKNGSGKTTIIEAVSFALFGRTLKSVKKDNIVNKHNRKDCLVVLHIFDDIKQCEYVIERGIKPKIFNITRDGESVLLENDKDAQKFIEDEIINASFSVFCNLFSVAKTKYKGFMQLSVPERRVLVEELLKIGMIKEYSQKISDKIKDLSESKLISTSKLNQMRDEYEHLKKLKKKADESKSDDQEKIKENKKLLEEYKKSYEKLNDEKKELMMFRQDIENKKNTEEMRLSKIISQGEHELKTLNETKDKIINGDDKCSLCLQDITDKQRDEIIGDYDKRISVVGEFIDENKTLLQENDKVEGEKLKNERDRLDKKMEEVDEVKSLVDKTESLLDYLTSSQSKDDDGDIVARLKLIKDDGIKLSEDVKMREKEIFHYDFLKKNIFCDAGVRAKMIENILPSLITEINDHLLTLGASFNFFFDNNFSECENPANGELAQYDAFSAGEQARIDIAIMSSWRKVLAGVADVNLPNTIFMDEIMDGGVDDDGIIDLLNSLKEMDSQFILVTHREDAQEISAVDTTITARKQGGFTELEFS